jgi:hypothetical protein
MYITQQHRDHLPDAVFRYITGTSIEILLYMAVALTPRVCLQLSAVFQC